MKGHDCEIKLPNMSKHHISDVKFINLREAVAQVGGSVIGVLMCV